MTMDKDYYVARGRSLEVIEEHHQQVVAYVEESLRIVSRFGIPTDSRTSRTLFDSGGFVGIEFPLDQLVPEGWVRDHSMPGFVFPDRSRKKERTVGKALCKALKELPRYPSQISLCYKLCGQPFAWSGPFTGSRRPVGYYLYEDLGGKIVLSIQAGGKAPYDAEPILRSEYWRMREEESSRSPSVSAERAPS